MFLISLINITIPYFLFCPMSPYYAIVQNQILLLLEKMICNSILVNTSTQAIGFTKI